jgi:hypothetical protein
MRNLVDQEADFTRHGTFSSFLDQPLQTYDGSGPVLSRTASGRPGLATVKEV